VSPEESPFDDDSAWFSGALSANELRDPGMKGLAFGFNWNDPSMVLRSTNLGAVGGGESARRGLGGVGACVGSWQSGWWWWSGESGRKGKA